MIYQTLNLNEPTYTVGSPILAFPEHRHPEIELIYCSEGTYSVLIDKTLYTLHKGDLAIIGSMHTHEIPDANLELDSSCVFIEAGPIMLGNLFYFFATKELPSPVLNLNNIKHRELYKLMEETNYYKENSAPSSFLRTKGNIYKIFSVILDEITNYNTSCTKEINPIVNIEKALEYIYNNYSYRITLDDVAALCGYSKSNFCKVFKEITGETFNKALNNHRLKMSCLLLQQTKLSIESIALQVGLGDSKNFCRVFKSNFGVSPGAYRKN